MTDGHISRATLETYAKRGLAIRELEHVDRHLAECEPCRHALLDFTSYGLGLLNAIAVEQKRHLSFEQLEAALEGRTETDLDDLARQHLSQCDVCQRELADLKVFDAQLSEVAAEPPPHRPPSLWRTLFWPVSGLVGAVAAAVLVVVNTGIIPVGTRAIQMTVTLGSSNPDESGERIRSLAGTTDGPELPVSVLQRLQDASREAAITGNPQTIRFTLSASEYETLSTVVSALGRIESADTPGGRRIEVSLTIQPPARRE
jgi:hypothetical protein